MSTYFSRQNNNSGDHKLAANVISKPVFTESKNINHNKSYRTRCNNARNAVMRKWTSRLSTRFYNVEFFGARRDVYLFARRADFFQKVSILKILNCIFK